MSAELGPIHVSVIIDKEGNIEDITTDLENLDTTTKRVTESTAGWNKGLSAGGRLVASAAIGIDRLSIAQAAVENAQIRQMIAQDRLNDVIDKYGAGTKEAVQAQRQLEISTRGVDIANQRMYIRMIFGVGILIPEMISQFGKLRTALDGVSVSTIFQTAATVNLTRARLMLLGVTTLGIGAAIGFIAGGALASQVQSNDVNVYGDVDLQGMQTSSDFYNQLGKQNGVAQARSVRP